ncbi:ankyrin repeat and SOCS box protein 8-like [Mytilus edulis]|uniref:ankyrin repeat and SOCS box protein 8-like n=1 Tax=Mytilus edulis TaxID=6550 RepID=UPI0039F1118A
MDYFEDDLHRCIIQGDAETLREYLKKGLDVNHAFRSNERPERVGKTMVETAIENDQINIVQALVQNGCNTNLKYIVDVFNYTYILKPYKKRERLKLTIMFKCIVKEDVPMVKLLVQGGFDVNIVDDRGWSPLLHAVDMDNYEMVKAILISDKCDVNIKDTANLRPLHMAAMHANSKIASQLVRRGAKVDVVQIRGWTPLILTCRANCVQTTRLLLLNGANPNHTGLNGHTPLSTALQFSTCKEIPEMLLEAGASVDITLIKRCQSEKFQNLILHPELMVLIKYCAESPQTLRTLSCLVIRNSLIHSSQNIHLMKKVEQLPLPKLIKEYILLGHL